MNVMNFLGYRISFTKPITDHGSCHLKLVFAFEIELEEKFEQ